MFKIVKNHVLFLLNKEILKKHGVIFINFIHLLQQNNHFDMKSQLISIENH